MEYFQKLSELLPPEADDEQKTVRNGALKPVSVTEVWKQLRACTNPSHSIPVMCIVDFPYRDFSGPRNINGLDLPLDRALLERAWVFSLTEFMQGQFSDEVRMIVHGHTFTRWKDRSSDPRSRTCKLTAVNVRLAFPGSGGLFSELSGNPLTIVPLHSEPWRRCFQEGESYQEDSFTWQLKNPAQLPVEEKQDSLTKAEYKFLRQLLVHAEKALDIVSKQGPEILDEFFLESLSRDDTMGFVRGGEASIGKPEVHFLHRGIGPIKTPPSHGPAHGSSPSSGLHQAAQGNVQTGSQSCTPHLHSSPRVHALCIGVDQYEHFKKLKNAVSDASAMHNAIKQLAHGESEICENVSSRKMLVKALLKFCQSLPASEPPDLVMVYYAGHGLQDTTNIFLVPAAAEVDTTVDELAMLREECYSLDEMFKVLRGCRGTDQRFLVIIDACRTSLAQRGGDAHFDFDSAEACGPKQGKAPKNLALLLSSSRGGEAWDSFAGTQGHSPVAFHLLHPQNGAFAPNIGLASAIKGVCDEVEQMTSDRQCPQLVNIHKVEPLVLNGLNQQTSSSLGEQVPASVNPDLLRVFAFAGLSEPHIKSIIERTGATTVEDLHGLAAHVDFAVNSKNLEDLPLVPKTKFKEILLRMAANAAQDVEPPKCDGASTASTELRENSFSDESPLSVNSMEIISAYNPGDVQNFAELIGGFLLELQSFCSKKPPLCLMILMETVRRMQFSSDEQKIAAMNWFHYCKMLKLDAEVVDSFESLFLAGTPPAELKCNPGCDSGRELACVHVTNNYVCRGLLREFSAEEIEKWQSDVVQRWRVAGEDATEFCARADEFLWQSLDVDRFAQNLGIMVLNKPFPTKSFVVFLVLGRLQEMVLFTFLSLSSLDSTDSQHTSRLCGFTRMVSSTRNAWAGGSRQPTGAEEASKLLQLLTHFSYEQAEMLPVRLTGPTSQPSRLQGFPNLQGESMGEENLSDSFPLQAVRTSHAASAHVSKGAREESGEALCAATQELRHVARQEIGIGSRLEVLWDIDEGAGRSRQVWWGCTLDKPSLNDGSRRNATRYRNIWQLVYDRMVVEGVTYHSETHNVVFVRHDKLTDLSESPSIDMRWRVDGNSQVSLDERETRRAAHIPGKDGKPGPVLLKESGESQAVRWRDGDDERVSALEGCCAR